MTYVLPVQVQMRNAYGELVGAERQKATVRWPKNAAVSKKPLACGK